MNEIKEIFGQKIDKSMQIFNNHLKQSELNQLQIEQNNSENAFRKFEKFV